MPISINSQIHPLTLKKKQGQYYVADIAVSDLAKQYKTPLFVMDEATIRYQCQQFTQALAQYYPDALVLYASKANTNKGLLSVIGSEGLGIDVVSAGELLTALNASIKPDRIYFHGNNKTEEELDLAIHHGVTIVVDNLAELRMLSLKNVTSPIPVLLRIKPEVQTDTHHHIQTGQYDSKFGITVDELEQALPYFTFPIQYQGLHAHIGSQLLSLDPYLELIDKMTLLLSKLQKHHGLETPYLNIGGGFGVAYLNGQEPLSIQSSIEKMCERVKQQCKQLGLPLPKLLLEPGRCLVANAGITVYTVGFIKPIANQKTYLFVDGGMADNPRPIMYGADYSVDLNKTSSLHRLYDIAGKYCESGDILVKNKSLPEAESGDLLLVFATGAYNYSMASRYNRSLIPAMVMVNQGRSRLLVKRETHHDLLALDVDLPYA